MTSPTSAPSEDRLPPARLVRWLLLAAVILFSAGLFFRYGLNVQPIPQATTTTP
jgi:hypothetical protein